MVMFKFIAHSFTKAVLWLFLLCCSSHVKGQDCHCNAQFEFVYTYIEANSPAYHTLKQDAGWLKNYQEKKQSLLEITSSMVQVDSCLKYANQYLELIKDHHTRLFLNKKTQAKPVDFQTNPLFEFRPVNEKVNYLKISTFSRQHLKELSQLYDSIWPSLTSTPYLILDLRNNGGGSDESWHRLLPLIYTGKFETDKVMFWASESNIRHYSTQQLLPKTLLESIAVNTFFTMLPGKVSSFGLKKKSRFPQKIFLLQNSNVASAAEDFILMACQSKKVMTLGENTGGYTGYGNVRSAYSPDKIFLLNCTTTLYEKGRRYEFVGIPPDQYLASTEDWMQTALKLCD